MIYYNNKIKYMLGKLNILRACFTSLLFLVMFFSLGVCCGSNVRC